MKGKRIKFADHFRVKHGFAFKSEYFADEGPYALLTPSNFNEEGGFRHRGDKQPYYTGEVPPAYILSKGDVIIAMTEQDYGLLCSSVWVPSSDYFLHNQRLGLITDLDEKTLNKRFLYYLFNTREVRHQIAGSASGTKVRHTAPERVGRIEVEVPDTKSQERIADILTAYDDLMENNRRRMALLEESARQLYREWFVRLRSPGMKKDAGGKMKTDLPPGWERVPLGDKVTLNYGKALKADERVEGDYPVYGSSGIVGTHEKALVKGPGIILGRKGNVGSVYWSSQDFYPIDTVYFITSEESSLYLFYALKHMHFISTDVAVPGLNRDLAYSRPLVIPPQRVLSAFHQIVEPIHEQLGKLTEVNEKLRTARDLLLPRLMSGEIEV